VFFFSDVAVCMILITQQDSTALHGIAILLRNMAMRSGGKRTRTGSDLKPCTSEKHAEPCRKTLSVPAFKMQE